MSHGAVVQVEDDQQFAAALLKAANDSKVAVVDFFASWCGPCHRIAPNFVQLSLKFKDSVFLKVDVDKCQETAALRGVSAMPTFHVYKANVKVDELRGADPVALEKLVEKHCTASSGGGEVGAGYCDLNSCIDFPRSECLNESDEHGFREAFKKEAGYLESDCDEQLLMTIAFTQPIRLHSLQLFGPQDGRAPKTVKLFINQTAIDFASAERSNCVQELKLTKDDVAEDALIPLKYVKFQNVVSLTVFVKDNQGGEETSVIKYLGFIGQTREKSDMKEFKRVSGTKGEAHG